LSKSSSGKSKSKSVTYSSDIISLVGSDIAEGDEGGQFSTGNRGGKDTFLGVSGQVNIAYGEIAGAMSGGARGGDDKFVGGDDALNLFIGDASSLSGKGTRGGDDVFLGGDALGNDGYLTLNVAFGDASGYGAPTPPDVVEPTVFSAAEVTPAGLLDSLIGIGGSLLAGITEGGLTDGSRGGDDKLYGGDVGADGYAVINLLVGDANFIGGSVAPASGCKDSDDQRTTEAGDDRLYGGSVLDDGYAINLMAGDAFVIDAGGEGGDDRLVGGDGNLDGYAGMGPDTAPTDVEESTGPAIALNLLVGDAVLLNGEAGDDKVQGGDGALNLLLGDGYAAGPEATQGDDVLISGEGSLFLMLGDSIDGYGSGIESIATTEASETEGGEDRFVIEHNSFGVIVDFDATEGDRIDLSRLLGTDDDDCDDDGAPLIGDLTALLQTIITDEGAGLPFGLGGAVLDFSLADPSYGLGSGAVVVAGVTAEDLEANLWQVFIL